MRTITEAAKIVGLTRRMIQEYEMSGIAIKPSDTNKYGYWDYDDEVLARLWQIRVYKELGLKPREMKAVFNDPEFDQKVTLEKQINLLEKKKQEIENLIDVAKLMNETGITPQSLSSHATLLDGFTFEDSFDLLGIISRQISQVGDIADEELLSAEETASILEAFNRVVCLYRDGVSYDASDVQKAVRALHMTVSPWLSEMVSGLYMATAFIAPGSEAAEELEVTYKLPGVAEFVQMAISKYVEDNSDKGPDKEFADAIDAILSYGKRKIGSKSEEVQAIVDRIYALFATVYNPEVVSPREAMERYVQIYADPSYRKFFDRMVRGRGAGKYVYSAFKHYCSELDKNEN